jgi:hypothetical protein
MDLGRKALHLYAASGRACALFEGGAIRCWGSGQGGQLGYGNRNDIRDSQALAAAGDVDVGGKVLQLALGGEITCALLDSGAVRCWGRGAIGYPAQRATASKPFRAIGADLHPAGAGDVDVGGRVTSISASGEHVCALLEGGRVRCWGSGFRGQLGYGNDHDVGQRDTPASAGDVDIGGKVVQLAAGEAHTCALLDTGAVRCWGQGEEGRLGYGNARSIGDDETPASAGDVAVGGKVVQIAAGGFHTCALLATGAVRCWGLGEQGELGYGNAAHVGLDDKPEAAGDVPVVVLPAVARAAATPAVTPLTFTAAPELTNAEHDTPGTCEPKCVGCSTVYDSRHFTDAPKRELSAHEKELVTDALKQHLAAPACAADPVHLHPSLVGTKEDPSMILNVIDGSFTESGRHQSLVLLLAGHCGAMGGHSENWGERLVILLEGNARLATFVDDTSPSLLYKLDLNHDGIDEVLAWGGWAGAGGSSGWIEPRTYAGTKQRTLAHFDTSEADCGFGNTKRVESLVQARWSASTSACFLQRRFTLHCAPLPH